MMGRAQGFGAGLMRSLSLRRYSNTETCRTIGFGLFFQSSGTFFFGADGTAGRGR